MHKRLVIFAIVVIILVFFITQISQQRHSLTGKIVEKQEQEDLFLAQENPPLQTSSPEEPPRTAFQVIVRWVKSL